MRVTKKDCLEMTDPDKNVDPSDVGQHVASSSDAGQSRSPRDRDLITNAARIIGVADLPWSVRMSFGLLIGVIRRRDSDG
jgi:hypothetical protein